MTTGAALWGVAVWDAPAPVGRWRGAALLITSGLAGFLAGGLWLLASAIRRVARVGAEISDAVLRPLRRGHRSSGGLVSRLHGRGRRASAWLVGAAWTIFALDAALLYLTLY